jgi:hypothetical protein
MKKIPPLFVLLLVAFLANAKTIYEDYESYYVSLNGLFKTTDKKTPTQLEENQASPMGVQWIFEENGNKHKIETDSKTIHIDNQVLNVQDAKIFPNEYHAALENTTELYFKNDFVCLEDMPLSASGSAVRHSTVYLMNIKKSPNLFVKLPSLFTSCLNVRVDTDGSVLFNDVVYRYEKGDGKPIGVTFVEYQYKNNSFLKTGKKVIATFPEQLNVYKFSVSKVK